MFRLHSNNQSKIMSVTLTSHERLCPETNFLIFSIEGVSASIVSYQLSQANPIKDEVLNHEPAVTVSDWTKAPLINEISDGKRRCLEGGVKWVGERGGRAAFWIDGCNRYDGLPLRRLHTSPVSRPLIGCQRLPVSFCISIEW